MRSYIHTHTYTRTLTLTLSERNSQRKREMRERERGTSIGLFFYIHKTKIIHAITWINMHEYADTYLHTYIGNDRLICSVSQPCMDI